MVIKNKIGFIIFIIPVLIGIRTIIIVKMSIKSYGIIGFSKKHCGQSTMAAAPAVARKVFFNLHSSFDILV